MCWIAAGMVYRPVATAARIDAPTDPASAMDKVFRGRPRTSALILFYKALLDPPLDTVTTSALPPPLASQASSTCLTLNATPSSTDRMK